MTLPLDPVWQPPDAILHRIAAELQQGLTMLHAVEAAVAPMVHSAPDTGSIHALQEIDRLGQTLADLANCLAMLAADLHGAPAIDARGLLSGMRLDDLAQRLGGRTVTAAAENARVALF